MRLDAAPLQHFARFTGCALHSAGRCVSVAWARLRLRLDPPPCEGCFPPICGMCSKPPPLDSLDVRSQRGGSRRHSQAHSAYTRGASPPRCTIGSWAPLTVWGRSTFAAPPMPTGETLGRLRLAAACSGLLPCPKGLCPLDSHTRRREARVLGQAVAALPSSRHQSQRLGRSSQHQPPFAAYPRPCGAAVFHGGVDPALR
uniref:Uncharacterized protein n=1 Tax=Vibrio cholerae TaxID=666 RepID=Q0GPC0_VIBCL|nr:unknown [Vibrio cholerae]